MKKTVKEQPLAPGQADVPGLCQKIRQQAEEIAALTQFCDKAKILLHIYDGIDDADYLKYLDSFVLAAERKYEKTLPNEERLAFRGEMKDFIESRMTETK